MNNRLLTEEELEDLYWNPPTTMANEYVPECVILTNIAREQDTRSIKLRDKEWIELLENTFEPTVPMTLSYEKWVEIKSKMGEK